MICIASCNVWISPPPHQSSHRPDRQHRRGNVGYLSRLLTNDQDLTDRAQHLVSATMETGTLEETINPVSGQPLHVLVVGHLEVTVTTKDHARVEQWVPSVIYVD